MNAPRPRGRYKKRLSLNEVKDYTRNNIEIPKDVLLPKESTGAHDLRVKMKALGWLIFKTHGDEFFKGFPDLICVHLKYGTIYVETKSFRKNHVLEDTQIKVFMDLDKHGAKVYVARSADDYHDVIMTLTGELKTPNWHLYIQGR